MFVIVTILVLMLSPMIAAGTCAPVYFDEPRLIEGTLGMRPEVVADFNRDGNPDVIVSNASDHTVGILFGDGSGSFMPLIRTALPYTYGIHPIAADLNNDGKVDLVYYAPYDGLYVFLGDGAGHFFVPSIYPYQTVGFPFTESDRQFGVAHFNADARLDIVVPSRDGDRVVVLLGDGRGGFGPPIPTDLLASLPTPTFLGSDGRIAYGDINGDRMTDFTLPFGDRIGIFLADGNGSFRQGAILPLPAAPAFFSSTLVADVNGDGSTDVLAFRDEHLAVLTGDGHGSFRAPIYANVPYAPGVGFNDIGDITKDYNADGRLDLLWNGSVLLGNGQGRFDTELPVADVSALAAGDLNRDGRADLLGQAGDHVAVILNRCGLTPYTPTPTPTLDRRPSPTVPSPSPVPTSVCAGDCDGSGEVTIDEIVSMVNAALELPTDTECGSGDTNHDGQITVDEIVISINKALLGCQSDSTPAVSLVKAEVEPFSAVQIRVSGLVSPPIRLTFDLSNDGIEHAVSVPARLLDDHTIEATAPPGVMSVAELFTAGTANVYVTTGSNSGWRSQSLPLKIRALPTFSGTPGAVTRGAIAAFSTLSRSARGDLQRLDQASRDRSSVEFSPEGIASGLEQLESALQQAIGAVCGDPGTTCLPPSSLAILDRVYLGMLRALQERSVSGSGALALRGGVASSEDDFSSEFLAAISNTTEKSRDALDKIGTVVTYTATAVAVVSAVVGAGALVIPAGTVAAVGFLATTMAGGATTLAIDGGMAAMLNGRATFDDIKADLQFLGDGVANNIIGAGIDEFGLDPLGSVPGVSDSVLQLAKKLAKAAKTGAVKIAGLIQEAVDAFDNLRLPWEGIDQAPPTPIAGPSCQDTLAPSRDLDPGSLLAVAQANQRCAQCVPQLESSCPFVPVRCECASVPCTDEENAACARARCNEKRDRRSCQAGVCGQCCVAAGNVGSDDVANYFACPINTFGGGLCVLIANAHPNDPPYQNVVLHVSIVQGKLTSSLLGSEGHVERAHHGGGCSCDHYHGALDGRPDPAPNACGWGCISVFEGCNLPLN